MPLINIDTTVYDTNGNFAFNVTAYPEGKPQDQAYILADGELIMDNVEQSATIVFMYQGIIIYKIPASFIGSTIQVDKTLLGEVEVVANKKSNAGKIVLGFLALFGLGYLVLNGNSIKE